MSADFDALVERAMRAGNRSHMRPVIETELLHYDILFALDRDGLLDVLTFQGGTSLRLCYGAQRFSEDLDFVCGRDFDFARLGGMKAGIERYLEQRYVLDVTVKEPRDLARITVRPIMVKRRNVSSGVYPRSSMAAISETR